MRAGFLLAVLAAGLVYTGFAFAELAWLGSTGRLGPGFFPRIVGVALVAFAAHGVLAELRREAREGLSGHWRPAAALAGLSALFVAALDVLGGLVSMILFMGAALAALNRGRPLQNVLLALLLPAGVYLLFRVWLNASMPRGLLPF
jgi:hypothetical protein